MVITQRQKDVLNHVLADKDETPQGWADRVEVSFPNFVPELDAKGRPKKDEQGNVIYSTTVRRCDQMMQEKVSKHEASYDAEVLAGNYNDAKAKTAIGEQEELDAWASDLPTAKAKAKAELSYRVGKHFEMYIDPAYLKYSRKVARGNGQQPKPDSSITDYEDALTTNQDTADILIDALTTVKECKEFYGMVYPAPPTP
uniref:Uncharacterized protein n=1 Tax=uncultured marine virus TaxID=186617 RepID=A0A0F7L607_9VIRU|nr:hypothetical protein [uncultured marine virus]